MDTNRIRQFCALVENGNLRRTADLLGISHSGLSKSLHALEDEISLRLILPQGRGLVISEEGLRFYEKAKKLLAVEKEILETSSVESTLRIASYEKFSTYFIHLLLDEFPTETMLLLESGPGKLETKLLNQEVDYILTTDPVLKKGIVFDKIVSIDVSVFANNKSFNQLSFDELPFVAPVKIIQELEGEDIYLDGFPTKKKRNIKYRVHLMETALEIVRCGKAAIYIPHYLAKIHNTKYQSEFHLHHLKNFAQYTRKKTIFIARRESTPEGAIHKKLSKILRKLG